MATKLLDKTQATKDGRRWVFYDWVTQLDGTRKKYYSKKYATKKEALEGEREFMTRYTNIGANTSSMTFKELYQSYYNYQTDKVKFTTMKTYRDRIKFFKDLENVKVNDFTILHFERWKEYMNKQNLSTNHKNHIYKFFKAILNYGTKWYGLNFSGVYVKMTNFTNPNEMPKEMDFWTYEEFQQFIACEQDILYKALYETLYYCGLRRGELRGLTWEEINFEDKTLRVKNNVVSHIEGKKFIITTPKTKTSNRVIPMPDVLVNDLKAVYENAKKYHSFNKKWFVFGDVEPISNGKIRTHKVKNCNDSGVKEIRIHDFRHSCASLLINNGASINMVAKYLGHTKIDETLNTYSHLFKNKMNEIVNLINNL